MGEVSGLSDGPQIVHGGGVKCDVRACLRRVAGSVRVAHCRQRGSAAATTIRHRVVMATKKRAPRPQSSKVQHEKAQRRTASIVG